MFLKKKVNPGYGSNSYASGLYNILLSAKTLPPHVKTFFTIDKKTHRINLLGIIFP